MYTFLRYYYIGDKMKINIINACSDLGVNIDGASLGPQVIKKKIYTNEHINQIIDVKCSCNNKDSDSNNMKKNIARLNKFNSDLYNTLIKLQNDSTLNITIGGDHSIAIASALASIKSEENLGIIWIDTHPDFNTFETTITGNIHGVPLATVTQNNGYELTGFHSGNYYKNENTVMLGVRDINPPEKIFIDNYKIRAITTNELKTNNLVQLTNDALNCASKNTNGIHLSIDLDVLDPEVAPGISVGFDNGLSKEELFKILDIILEKKELIKSIDLVEFNPINDKDNKTLNIAIEILEKIINKLK